MKIVGILCAFVIAIMGCNAQSSEVQNLSQADLKDKLQKNNVVLIDARSPSEVQEGYIPEATHFIDIKDENFDSKISELDSSKTYIIYCKSGVRSRTLANFMISKGFSNVYNLEGGILGYKGPLKQ